MPTPAEARGDFERAGPDRRKDRGVLAGDEYRQPAGNSNFIGSTSNINPNNYYVARADHTIRDNDRVFGRFLKSGPINDTPAHTIAGVDSSRDIN